MSTKMYSWGIIALVLSLVGVGVLPWGIDLVFEPLRPPALAETPWAYQPTEAAFATREAEIERSATSSFTILPVEDDSFPVTETPMQERIAVPEQIFGAVTQDVPIFSCPYPSDQTDALWPAGQPFMVHGWNIDLDDVVYLLIEDDPAKPQMWIQLGPDVTLSFENYRLTFGRASGCRTWASAASTPEGAPSEETPAISSGPTATIPLPMIRTATPLPPQQVRIEVTEEEATEQLAEESPDIKEPTVYFTPDEVRITGEVEISTPIGGIDGDLEIKGTLALEEGKLYFHTTSLTARGRDYTDKEESDDVEYLVNAWLAELMVRRSGQSFELRDGLLIIDAFEYQESALPTPRPELTPTAIDDVEGQEPLASDSSLTPIPLPAARSVTVTPGPGTTRAITNEQATIRSRTDLPVLSDPRIEFSTSGVTVIGEIAMPLAIPGLDASGGMVEFTGELGVEDGQLKFAMQDFALEGAEIVLPEVKQIFETAVSEWVPNLQDGMSISDFILGDGTITLFP